MLFNLLNEYIASSITSIYDIILLLYVTNISCRGEFVENTHNRLVTIVGTSVCAQRAHLLINQRLQVNNIKWTNWCINQLIDIEIWIDRPTKIIIIIITNCRHPSSPWTIKLEHNNLPSSLQFHPPQSLHTIIVINHRAA